MAPMNSVWINQNISIKFHKTYIMGMYANEMTSTDFINLYLLTRLLYWNKSNLYKKQGKNVKNILLNPIISTYELLRDLNGKQLPKSDEKLWRTNVKERPRINVD